MNLKPNIHPIAALTLWLVTACTADAPPETPEPEAIAQVATVKLQKTTMNATLSAYGVVLPFPEHLQTLSVPYNCEIESIQVIDGQWVQAGAVLLTVKAAEDASLQLSQAQEELDAAVAEHQLFKERVRLKLATQQDLVTAQLRVDQAKVVLNNLTQRGIGNSQALKAEQAGIVTLVNVQQGQRVAAGNPLLQWVANNHWGVRLGVEAEDFGAMHLQQEVLIKTPAQTLKGKMATIAQQVDPVTRLLAVWVKPENNARLLINEFVQADIVLSSAQTLVAPRQAVLPDGAAYSLFTVVNGHAVKHAVKIGLENNQQVEVLADDVKEQDELVILGNYELEDGMAVEVQQP
jgi:RND family efflux transporter MFP subunit